MNKSILVIIGVIVTFLFTSCTKKSNDKPNNNKSTEEIGFFFAENGNTNYTKADSVLANQQYKTIIAKVNGATVVEFVATDFSVGDYPLNTQYAFTYVKDNSHWEASAGTLKITQNDGQTISGTYEATAGTGVNGVTTVSGYFKKVPLQ